MPNEKPICYTNEQIKQAAEICLIPEGITCLSHKCPFQDNARNCRNEFAARLLELDRENADLRARLAESEKREKAAVKDIMCKDHCDVCICGKDADGECGTNDFDCLTCKSKTCMCRTCRNEDKWEWRGLTAQEGNK